MDSNSVVKWFEMAKLTGDPSKDRGVCDLKELVSTEQQAGSVGQTGVEIQEKCTQQTDAKDTFCAKEEICF